MLLHNSPGLPTMMLLLYFTLVCFIFQAFGQEPLCNKFSFQEQLLDKMVRIEFKVETMFNDMAKTQAKVEKELHAMSKERERMKSEVNVYKSDVRKKLTDSAKAMEFAISDFEAKIGRFSRNLLEFQKNTSASKKGLSVTYIRWGRTVCPETSRLLYDGYASGSHFSHHGGVTNTVCLPKQPQCGKSLNAQNGNYLYNSKYKSRAQLKSIFDKAIGKDDVPCAVCQADEKVTVLMVPARMECHEGWRLEYCGYLMTAHQGHEGRTDLKCVDANPETVPGQGGDNEGNLFYFVEAGGTLPDPPYTRGKELTCAVCTR